MRGPAIALTAAIGGALLVPAAPLADEPPAPPTAALETASTTVAVGKTVTLDSSASKAGTGAIVGHVWDLDGNGSFETDTGDKATVDTTPRNPGPLTVRVRVVDDRGLDADAKLDLTVTAAPKMEAAGGTVGKPTSDAPASGADQPQPQQPDQQSGQPGAQAPAGQPNAPEPSGRPAPAAGDPAAAPADPTAPAEPAGVPADPSTAGVPAPAPAPLTAARMSAAPTLLPRNTLADSRTSTIAAAKAGAGTTVTAAAASTSVTIKNFSFSPGSTSVHVGDTITWTNQDVAPHTATASDGSFNTGTINQGKSGSHTFTTAGTFPYICSIHPSMKGTVTVAAASGSSSGGGGGGGGGGSTDSGAGSGSGATPSDTGAGLPHTGLNVAAVVLLAALMTGSGSVLRRRVG